MKKLREIKFVLYKWKKINELKGGISFDDLLISIWGRGRFISNTINEIKGGISFDDFVDSINFNLGDKELKIWIKIKYFN